MEKDKIDNIDPNNAFSNSTKVYYLIVLPNLALPSQYRVILGAQGSQMTKLLIELGAKGPSTKKESATSI